MALKDYSPKNVTADWAGYTLEGYSDGTFISASRNTENTNATVGAAGDVGITVSADKTGTITVTIMQTSETNAVLSRVQNTQDLTGSLLRANFTITDPSGSNLMIAQNCHLQTPAEMIFADDQQSRTWVWYSERIDFIDVPDELLASADKAARITNALSGIIESSKNIDNSIS